MFRFVGSIAAGRRLDQARRRLPETYLSTTSIPAAALPDNRTRCQPTPGNNHANQPYSVSAHLFQWRCPSESAAPGRHFSAAQPVRFAHLCRVSTTPVRPATNTNSDDHRIGESGVRECQQTGSTIADVSAAVAWLRRRTTARNDRSTELPGSVDSQTPSGLLSPAAGASLLSSTSFRIRHTRSSPGAGQHPGSSVLPRPLPRRPVPPFSVAIYFRFRFWSTGFGDRSGG